MPYSLLFVTWFKDDSHGLAKRSITQVQEVLGLNRGMYFSLYPPESKYSLHILQNGLFLWLNHDLKKMYVKFRKSPFHA